MGHSSSKVSIQQKYQSTVINSNDINVMNSLAINVSTTQTVNQAQSCGATSTSDQVINLPCLTISGDAKVNISQLSKSKVDFSCVQTSSIETSINNSLTSLYTELITNMYTNKALNTINNNISNNQSNGGYMFGPLIQPSQSDQTNMTATKEVYQTTNSVTQNITNAINKPMS